MKVGDTVTFLVRQEYDTASGGIQKKGTIRKGKIVKLDGSWATVKLTNGIVKKFNVSELKLADLEES